MENHPIPQDITGFQFKLVGKMTVRQFIYVGVGVFLAWLIYFVLKLPLFLSLPLALFFSLGGTALAFLPIDGRPMDLMIRNFIRSIISPTQYVYEKQGGSAFSPGQTAVTHQISQPLPAPQANVATQQITPPSPAPAPEQKLEEEEQKVEAQESEVEAEIKTAETNHKETSDLEKKLNEIIQQKEELEKELAEMKIKLESQNQAQTPPAYTEPVAPIQPTMPPPPPSIAPAPDLPTPAAEPAPNPIPTIAPQNPMITAPINNALPEEPNLVKGTVKDSRGNPIQNILVEVKDEEDNPVRAFKTNGKGEFASATSLPNGNYTVVLEDPKMVHKFDTSSVHATGAPITPLGIISIDPREELRRELFN